MEVLFELPHIGFEIRTGEGREEDSLATFDMNQFKVSLQVRDSLQCYFLGSIRYGI